MGAITRVQAAFEPGSKRLSRTVLVLKVLLMAVLIGELAAPLILSDPQPPVQVALRPPERAPSAGDTRHLNAAAGYTFNYPEQWKVADRATLSRLVAPGHGAVISAGVAQSGETDTASVALVRALEDVYGRVRVTDKTTRSEGATTRVELSGKVMSQGAPLDFEAIVLGRGVENFAIAAFVDPSTPPRLRNRVDKVLESFELSASV